MMFFDWRTQSLCRSRSRRRLPAECARCSSPNHVSPHVDPGCSFAGRAFAGIALVIVVAKSRAGGGAGEFEGATATLHWPGSPEEVGAVLARVDVP